MQPTHTYDRVSPKKTFSSDDWIADRLRTLASESHGGRGEVFGTLAKDIILEFLFEQTDTFTSEDWYYFLAATTGVRKPTTPKGELKVEIKPPSWLHNGDASVGFDVAQRESKLRRKWAQASRLSKGTSLVPMSEETIDQWATTGILESITYSPSYWTPWNMTVLRA